MPSIRSTQTAAVEVNGSQAHQQHEHPIKLVQRQLQSLDKQLAGLSIASHNGYPSENDRHYNSGVGDRQDEAELVEILKQLSIPAKVFLLSGSSFTTTAGAPDHGLHSAKCSDALSDVRGSSIFNGPATSIFPNASALGATFDTELLEAVGVAIGEEMQLKSVDVLLAPNLNLQRDPRAGRNNETFSECPVLAGFAGTAIVKGIHSTGGQTCPKHLVCNDSETSRREYDVQVDERTMREVYLRPFEQVIAQARPAAVMTAYNKINGTSASRHHHLLTDIIRNDWKYDGLVMSDWFGTYDGIDSLHAGMDLEMPLPASRGKKLLEAVSSGIVTEDQLDTSVKRVLRFLKKAKAPESSSRASEQATDNDLNRCARLRQTAAESIVLLKNDGSQLPFIPGDCKSIAVIGAMATTPTVSHLSSAPYFVTILDGLKAAVKDTNIKVEHAHGPAQHRLVPLIDDRYTNKIDYHLWNRGQRGGDNPQPVATETYHEAKNAFLLRKVPGLDVDFEVELSTTIKVPTTGTYTLGIVSGSDAEVFVDGKKVYTFVPDGVVDVQKFLFYQHTFEQTFDYNFEAGRSYHLTCISQSQKQSGPEPVATGLFIGMVEVSSVEERIQQAVELVKRSDKVVLCIGTTWEFEMEGIDRDTIKLPPSQEALLSAIIESRQGDVTVVVQSGAAIDLNSTTKAKAVLQAHWGGQEVGNAVADIVLGRQNPCGKSPYTWPARLEDCPSFGNFPHDDNRKIAYKEGLHMGWRGFEQAGASAKPLFAFGHGLSYSSFSLTEASVSGQLSTSSSISIQARVTNTGRRPGKQVVQLYLAGPADSNVERAAKTLEGFAKTSQLQPGESEIVNIPLGRRAFSFWDIDSRGWIVEAGTYKALLATSSDAIVEHLPVMVHDGFKWNGML